MEPGQSWFVVFADQKSDISEEGYSSNFPETEVITEIKGPWKIDFENKKIGPEQPVYLDKLTDLASNSAENIRFYSGTMVYSTEFEMSEIPRSKQVYIDLGDVKVIASVKVNGKDAGTSWMYPWKVEIGKLLKKGKNTVEVEVANLWRNRLILDSGLPKEKRYTWTIISEAKPGDIPPSSGLIGPVTLKTPVRQ